MARNSLCINAKKTNYIYFNLRETKSIEKTIILHTYENATGCETGSCSCSSLQRVSHTKYLGIILDEHLNFKQHVAHVAQNIRFGLYIISKIKNYANTTLLKILYFAFV